VVLDGAHAPIPQRSEVASERCCSNTPSRRSTPKVSAATSRRRDWTNVAYYQRFGYELIETLNPIEGAPTYYTMWRTPR